MKNLIQEYLDDHKTAWAETTYKNESYRLKGLAEYVDQDPEDVYLELSKRLKPYTIKTAFIRICNFEDWVRMNKDQSVKPKFRSFLKKHRNRFKHAYQKEEVQVTFEEAIERINQLEEPYKTAAMGLLRTGLRISELAKIDGEYVTGKGGKRRKIYGKIEVSVSPSQLAKKLRSVRLKAHTLRKLCATRLAERGATPADLCKVFGWTSINTSYQYLQSKQEERLAALVEESTKGP